MKVLITGVNGFVGKYLRHRLCALGHQVWGIDYVSNGDGAYVVDICDGEAVECVLKETMPEYIYHLAAASFVPLANYKRIYEVNVDGTLNLLRACCKLPTLPRVVFISSSQVYGNVPKQMQPIGEHMPLNPITHYGASKAMGEMLVKAFFAETGLEYVIFRPFNHTGIGQSEVFVIPKIVKAFKEGAPIVELGNIDVERDFCDVRDVVRAYAMVLENWKAQEVYNVSSGKAIYIKEIVEKLTIITGRKIEIKVTSAHIRKNEIMHAVGSYEKIKKELGWEPTISIEETLRSMINE